MASGASTVITLDVVSSTTLDVTGCPPLDATRTSLGLVLPGTPAVTAADCNVNFGSSNDSSTLRVFEADGRAAAMSSSSTLLDRNASGSPRVLDVDMATSLVGWAVNDGAAGTNLQKTTDGGATWSPIAADGIGASTEGIDAVSSTVAWTARSNSNKVARTVNGTTWQSLVLRTGPTPAEILLDAEVNRVIASDANHAWALGAVKVSGRSRARVWATTDGGTTWAEVWSTTVVDSEAIQGVALSPTNVVISTTAWSSGEGVLRSTDGTTFTSITPTATGSYYDIDTWDGVHLAAASGLGGVYVSSDAGATWTRNPMPVDVAMRGLDYASDGTIFAATYDGTVMRSLDHGATWTLLGQDVSRGRVFALDAVGSTVLITMHSSTIVRSTDSGATWSVNALAAKANWTGVDGVDGGRLWRVGGRGYIQTSTTGGESWSDQSSGVSSLLYDVMAIDRTTAVVVGSGGTILRTTDAGVTWTSVASPTTSTLRTIQDAPEPWRSTLWAGGDDGTLLRSFDAGATWAAMPSPTTQQISAITAWSKSELLVASTGGPSRAWTSTDAGATWTTRATGAIAGINAALAFPGSGVAFVIDGSGLRRTTDYGVTWNAIPIGSSIMFDADLAPDGTAWVAGEFTSMMQSTDHGLTWTKWTTSSNASSRVGFGIHAEATNRAIAVSNGGGAYYPMEADTVPDYDGASASWGGTGFFGMCLRAAPGAVSTWPTTGTCPTSDGTNWRAIPAHGGLSESRAASTGGSGTTTASFRFGMKAPASQAPGTYAAPITFEVLAPAT